MGQFGNEDLSSILFGSIPKHEDLCYHMGTIKLSENNAANVSNKAYQCQIYKCRCLIFTVSEVIASPVLGAVHNIHIIISKKYHKSGKLNAFLEKMNIKVDGPLPLTNAVYETCLRYTILARLAPSWNQVDKYLVHGRNFLLSSSPLDAVKLDVVINDTDMHVVLWPLRLRLPQVCAQDLQTSSFSSPFSWDLSSNNLMVHVLPSLNRANVVMVSGHIPQNSLFKYYKDLKRHWKNSYGYRLPDSEEGMMYVTVKFGRWFSESLTYPIMCVRARHPVFLRQLEPQRVLLAILADLHAKVPTICGHPFGIEANVRYALPKLNVLSQTLFPCNLTETKPEIKKEIDPEVEEVPVSQPVSQYTQYTQSQYSKLTAQSENKVRSRSPPPFLPRLSQLIQTNPPPKPLFVPVFTSKTLPPPSPSPSTSSSPNTHLPLAQDEPESVTVRPMFEGVPIKPIFGLARPSPLHKPFGSHFKTKSVVPYPMFNSISPSHMFNPARGEKSLLHVPEAGCKKTRNKPRVQQGVDVEALAHTKDGLSKVNTTTLIAYLRSQGVPCKVKDKKGYLVAKVLTHLKLPLPEAPPPHPLSPSPPAVVNE